MSYPPLTKDRNWPVPAISEAEFCTYRMVALWAGPDYRFLSVRIAGADSRQPSIAEPDVVGATMFPLPGPFHFGQVNSLTLYDKRD